VELLGSHWDTSGEFSPARQITIPENYAGIGSRLPFQRTPTIQPEAGPDHYNPHNPQWNNVYPIIWAELVLTKAEIDAIQQAGLGQPSEAQPSIYTPPTTASLADY
jgi:hypothetical protein